ncbi:Vitamin B12 import ATP-binding protein BtuD [bioreactor metagenome]|uniref:Vitamin B12 import ATP-binding protein BtuD n=1 Tax=bioreactor metagenome TaxID=1076179 RepID=A0A644XIF6_9ZZZZ
MKNAIEVSGLTKDYGTFQLDVSFTVPGGSIMGLIGENGAGKSTTLKAMLGLIRPDGGSVKLLGLDAAEEGSGLKEEIGVVFDECPFHDQMNASMVNSVLAGIYSKWDRELFAAYLQKFDLPANKKLKEFSRGMKMKLSIAAALSHRPRLLLLDEATSGLDPVMRDEILDEFLAFICDEEHAILVSSHITSDLEKVADYITYLHKGKVAMSGARDELLESHGKLVCTRDELAEVERSFIVGTRVSQYSCEALIRSRADFKRRYPNLTVDPVTLEDLMIFTVRGDAR